MKQSDMEEYAVIAIKLPKDAAEHPYMLASIVATSGARVDKGDPLFRLVRAGTQREITFRAPVAGTVGPYLLGGTDLLSEPGQHIVTMQRIEDTTDHKVDDANDTRADGQTVDSDPSATEAEPTQDMPLFQPQLLKQVIPDISGMFPAQLKTWHVAVRDYVTKGQLIATVKTGLGDETKLKAMSSGRVVEIETAAGTFITRVAPTICRIDGLDLPPPEWQPPKEMQVDACSRKATSAPRSREGNPPVQAKTAQHSAGKSKRNQSTRTSVRLDVLGTLLGILLIGGTVLNANGVFDSWMTEFDIWRNPTDYGYIDYADAQAQRDAKKADLANRANEPRKAYLSEGTIDWKGGRYRGPLKDQKPHGEGRFAFGSAKNAGEFLGTWIDGVRQPEGTLQFSFGAVRAIGHFNENWRMEGKGRFEYENGTVYDGEFLDGEYHGTGALVWTSDHAYSGGFQRGEYHGQGTFKSPEYGSYTGGYRLGELHGSGQRVYKSGTIYVGEFVMGDRHGKGTMRYNNGATYVGSFEANKRSGRGKLTFPTGGAYTGAFLEGEPHGQGVYKLPNGSVIEGDFRGGLTDGFVKIDYANGDSYTGEYKDAKRVGLSEFEQAVKAREDMKRMRQHQRDVRARYIDKKRREISDQRRQRHRTQRAVMGDNVASDDRGTSSGDYYWAIYQQSGIAGRPVGTDFLCPNPQGEDVKCYIMRKERVWFLGRPCRLGDPTDAGESYDTGRIIVYRATGDVTNVAKAVDNMEIREQNSQYGAIAGTRYRPLVQKFWDELLKETRVDRWGREYSSKYRSYADMVELSGGSCHISINANRGPSTLK